ncbi:sensor domain-containing diguanylate cyclase [Desulfitibacter alkalitolerans]|uniref:sensor domain-containing diguanylate cyclase n=1 Tax=Desulfitibacter alkalitolerans TaxID=264641 RepID=UPI000486B3E4|nr:sensor domain-containing diguanylate cyclase [Desulfitibacter alkalitolerans]
MVYKLSDLVSISDLQGIVNSIYHIEKIECRAVDQDGSVLADGFVQGRKIDVDEIILDIPINSQGRRIGLLQLVKHLECSINESAFSLMTHLANILKLIGEKQSKCLYLEKELVKTRHSLTKIIEFEKLIASIARRFISISAEEISEEINHTLRDIGEFSKTDRTYIFLVSEDKKTVNNTHEWCAGGIEAQIHNLQNIPVDSIPWWMGELNSMRNIYIPDVDIMPQEASTEQEILKAQEIKSVIVVPLTFKNTLIGFMGFDSVRDYKCWPVEHITLLKIVSEIIVSALRRKKIEEELRFLSLHDHLTGLYNRAYFDNEMLRLEKGRDYPISIIFLDMDNLKTINDTMGHQAGDQALKNCARLLKENLREIDVLARIGGDEFAVILPCTDEKSGEEIIRRVKDTLANYNLNKEGLPLSLSIGIATCNGPEHKLSDTLKRADDLMYIKKNSTSTANRVL